MIENNTPTSRRFTAPIWILAIVFCFRIFFAVSTTKALQHQQTRFGGEINKVSLWLGWVFVTLVGGQALIYWIVRKRIYRRSWLKIYLSLIFFSLVIIPLIFIALASVFTRKLNAESYTEMFRAAITIRFYLFWICFVAANLFFIMIVIKSSQEQPEAIEDSIDAIGTD